MSSDPRELLVEICHLLAARNFTTATGGNVSARLPDGGCWVTPGALHKARVRVEDLVRVAADGTIVEGNRKPSSEIFMHLQAYRKLPQAGAVVHAHPTAATGFAQAGRALETTSSSEAVAILGPDIPVIPYAPPSTSELAKLIGQAMQPTRKAYLMAHHGVLTWGKDLWDAYNILDTLELFAQSLVVSIQIGGPKALPESELEWLKKKHLELL